MTEQDFISECMSALKSDFPDLKQRFAVCKTKWNRGDTDVKSFNQEDLQNAQKLQNIENTQNQENIENTQKEILIFPRGKFYIEKYNEWLDFNDDFFNKIIYTFKNANLPKPFLDVDHQENESLGEIVDLFITNEGLKGVVELNSLGVELIKNKIYRYTSPHWSEIVDNNGRKWEYYLRSVSLTNIPALLNNISKVNNQLKLNFKEGQMKKINYELSQVTDDAIKRIVEDLIAQGEKQEEIIASLEKQVTELKAKLEEATKQNEILQKENEQIKEMNAEKEADEFVKKQLNDKKIDIAVVDFWKKQYKLNRDETIKYFDVLSNKQDDVAFKLSTKFNLKDEDLAVMKSCKLDAKNEKDVEFYLKVVKNNN